MSTQNSNGKPQQSPKPKSGGKDTTVTPPRTSSAPPNLKEQEKAGTNFIPHKSTVPMGGYYQPQPYFPPPAFVPGYAYPQTPVYQSQPTTTSSGLSRFNWSSKEIPEFKPVGFQTQQPQQPQQQQQVAQQQGQAVVTPVVAPAVTNPSLAPRERKPLLIIDPKTNQSINLPAETKSVPSPTKEEKKLPENGSEENKKPAPETKEKEKEKPVETKSAESEKTKSVSEPVKGDNATTQQAPSSDKSSISEPKEEEEEEEEEYEEGEEEEYEDEEEEEDGKIYILYEDNIWSPSNPSGSKSYPRSFLEQFSSLCAEKPDNLPDFVDPTSYHPVSYHRPVYASSPRMSKPPLRKGNKRGGPVLTPTPGRWEPARKKVLNPTEKVLRKVKAMLNKITEETYASLSKQINDYLNESHANGEIMKGVIDLVFEKALSEKKFVALYAELCLTLKDCKLVVEESTKTEGQKPPTFRRLLLEKCQDQFETNFGDSSQPQETVDLSKMSLEEKQAYEEKMFIVKKKIMGNIDFIGELYKKRLLTQNIMFGCIDILLSKGDVPSTENLEGLCRLLTTIGKQLEEIDDKNNLDKCFAKLKQLVDDPNYGSRIHYLMLDVIELRENSWVSRREIPKENLTPASSPMKEVKETVKESPSTPIRKNNPPNNNNNNEEDNWETVPTKGKGRGQYDKSNRNANTPTKPKAAETKKQQQQQPQTLLSNQFEMLEKSEQEISNNSSSGNSKATLSVEELEGQVETISDEFLSSLDENDALLSVKDLKAPSSLNHNIVMSFMNKGINSSKDKDREALFSLVLKGCETKTFLPSDLEKAFASLFEILSDLSLDIPKTPSFLAFYAGKALAAKVLTVAAFHKLLSSVDKNQQPTSIAVQALSVWAKTEDPKLTLQKEHFSLASLPDKLSKDKLQALLTEKQLQHLQDLLK